MKFEYKEDEVFFRSLLGKPFSLYKTLFDFKSPSIKREEYLKQREKLLDILHKRDKGVCQLQLNDRCTHDKEITIDHVIPLSSNILNKQIRHIARTTYKKVPSQSFGSNHIHNLILACANCNKHKKHRFLDKEKMSVLITNNFKYHEK